MMRKLVLSCAVLLLVVAAVPVRAEISKADRKQAKEMFSGTLYTRIDIPCGTGRHPMGTYKFPLVEVSPDSVNTDGEASFSASWYSAQSTYWGVKPNETLRLDDIDYGDEGIEVELEGVGKSDGNDTVIKFVGINSFADFKKAFDRAFSRVPLQDEHSDWSAEVKQAIANRQLQKGMTKRQAFYVCGAPESVKENTENGKKVEVWTLRENRGVQIGFWGASTGTPTGLPKTLRFVDGQLTDFEASGASGLKLDN